MLQDVAENGLHHAIVLRSNGASLELVLGQVRLAAFRMGAESEAAGAPVRGEAWSEYHDRATGITRIPAIVREMTDNEVIAASLSENLNRNSMVWSDETRALALAAEQPGITARQVAASAKMSPAQLSNRIRLLRLPDKILQLIDKDVLSWTAARELLAFAPPDHIHSDELEYCEKRLWAKHREYAGQGRETQRITAKQVMTVMANALNVEPDQWACLGTEIGQRGFWIRGNHFKPAPKFEVDAFKGKHGDWVHTLPYLWGTDPEKTEMTCVGWIWSEWQERAEKVEEEQARIREDEKTQNRLGPRATAFSNENPKAKYLPPQILELLDSGKLSETFVHRLMNGFVKNASHHHREHLEDIARRLQHLSGFKSPDKPMSDAAAGGAVLASVRKVLGSEFRSLDDRLTSFGFESPRFAMDEFIEEQQAMIHDVPIGIGIVRLTCTHGAWDAYQAREIQAIRQQVSRGNEPASPLEGEPAAQLQDLTMAETAEQSRKLPSAHMSSNPLCRPPETLTDAVHWHVVEESRPGWIMYSECLATHDEALAIYADSAIKPRWITKVSFDRLMVAT